MKTIVITGATSGIGHALAEHYSHDKSHLRLCLMGRDQVRLNEISNLCKANGALVETAIVDVTDADQMTKTLKKWDTDYKVDLLIANAGISGGTLIGDEDAEQMRRIFDVNVTGVINTVAPVLPYMIKRGHGQVALMSSLAGFRGLPSAPAYSGSKNAVRAWGEALRLNVKHHGVQVSVICPGFIKTPLTDQNKFEMPYLMPADQAAKIIADGLTRNKALIAFPWQMAWGIRLVSALPRALSDWIVSKFPNK